MITIYSGNLILIITDTCPADLAECAIRCLDHRPVEIVQQDWDDDRWMFIPKFSAFIGQLGAQSR